MSAEFSQAIVTRARQCFCRFQDGVLRQGKEGDGAVIPTPDEQSVFSRLGLVYVEPKQRIGPQALRMVVL